jgi:hypothetical protein
LLGIGAVHRLHQRGEEGSPPAGSFGVGPRHVDEVRERDIAIGTHDIVDGQAGGIGAVAS